MDKLETKLAKCGKCKAAYYVKTSAKKTVMMRCTQCGEVAKFTIYTRVKRRKVD